MEFKKGVHSTCLYKGLSSPAVQIHRLASQTFFSIAKLTLSHIKLHITNIKSKWAPQYLQKQWKSTEWGMQQKPLAKQTDKVSHTFLQQQSFIDSKWTLKAFQALPAQSFKQSSSKLSPKRMLQQLICASYYEMFLSARSLTRRFGWVWLGLLPSHTCYYREWGIFQTLQGWDERNDREEFWMMRSIYFL